MKKEKLIGFKLQNYLALIPYLGLPIVLFTSFYNIYSKKNLLYVGIYCLLTLIPFVFFNILACLVLKFFMSVWDDYTIVIIFSLILIFIVMLCIALSCLGIEKSMIKKFKKAEEQEIENNI